MISLYLFTNLSLLYSNIKIEYEEDTTFILSSSNDTSAKLQLVDSRMVKTELMEEEDDKLDLDSLNSTGSSAKQSQSKQAIAAAASSPSVLATKSAPKNGAATCASAAVKLCESVQVKKESCAKLATIQPVKVAPTSATSVKQVSLAQLKKSVQNSSGSVATAASATTIKVEPSNAASDAKLQATTPSITIDSISKPILVVDGDIQQKRKQIWSTAMQEVKARYEKMLQRRQEMANKRMLLATQCRENRPILKKIPTITRAMLRSTAATITTTVGLENKRRMFRNSPNRKRASSTTQTSGVKRPSPKSFGSNKQIATAPKVSRSSTGGLKTSVLPTFITPLGGANPQQGRPITLRLTQEQLSNLLASTPTVSPLATTKASLIGGCGTVAGATAKNITTILTTAGAATTKAVARNRRASQNQQHTQQLVL